MALSLVPRPEARALAMRPSSRDGLRALAAAWQATREPTATVRPFGRVVPQADTPSTVGEPPYWPDGPSAA